MLFIDSSKRRGSVWWDDCDSAHIRILATGRHVTWMDKCFVVAVCVHIFIHFVCACFDWFGPCTPTASCFDRVHSAITVNSIVQPNNGVRFPLLQVQGACYTVIFASLLLSVSPLISSSPPPCVSLQRACDSCKTLYQGIDLQCAAPSPPPQPPSLILPFDTLLKCNPPSAAPPALSATAT